MFELYLHKQYRFVWSACDFVLLSSQCCVCASFCCTLTIRLKRVNDASGSTACTTCPADAGVFLVASPSAASTACVCNAGFTAPMNGTEPMDCRWKQCTVSAVLSSPPFCSNALFLNLVSPTGPSFRSWQAPSSAGISRFPTYNPLGGPQGKGHVSFNRPQSQYLDAGPRTMNIATNGGLTIVAVVRFTTAGLEGLVEDIFDHTFSNVGYQCHITLRRSYNSLFFGRYESYSGSGSWVINGWVENVIVQSKWLSVVARYRASTREYWFTVNTAAVSGFASAAVTDSPSSTNTLLGSYGVFESSNNFNGDMAGVFVVDEYLSAEIASAIADDMVQGVDLSKSELCDTGPCVRCEAGTYKRTVGWSTALTLRPRPCVH